jgi:hypothetical protein
VGELDFKIWTLGATGAIGKFLVYINILEIIDNHNTQLCDIQK